MVPGMPPAMVGDGAGAARPRPLLLGTWGSRTRLDLAEKQREGAGLDRAPEQGMSWGNTAKGRGLSGFSRSLFGLRDPNPAPESRWGVCGDPNPLRWVLGGCPQPLHKAI